MGTSKSSSGPRPSTPLVPTWVDEPAPGAPVPANPPPIVPPIEPKRFQTPRTNFTAYVRTGKRSALGRALSGYVQSSSGGSRTASQRMAVPRRTAARILTLVQAAQAGNIATALRPFGLERLAGRPLADIYPELIDALCRDEDGGLGDEAIARDALTESVAEICDEGLVNGTIFSKDELHELFVRYVSHTIFDRVFNDIAQKGIALPEDLARAKAIETDVSDIITGCVRDSIGTQINNLQGMSAPQLTAATARIYQLAFDLIVTRANEL